MSYPAPILNLNFANAKQLAHPAVAFSRASQGSYYDGSGILRYANNSVPSFDHDPLTGICKGLLVEPAVTFLDTYSEQFDNAAWSKSRVTFSANATVAPDGTLTADKLIPITESGYHGINYYASISSGTTYTFSVCAKYGELQFLRSSFDYTLFVGTGATYFDIVSGITYPGANVTAAIKSCGNGWYICSITATATASGSNSSPLIYAAQSNGQNAYTGDGTSGLYIWGAKLYAGTGPTSYLPTTTAGVARAADVCSVDLTKLTRNGSPLWNGTEGTIVVDFISNYTPSAANRRIITLDDGGENNRVTSYIRTNGYIGAVSTVGGTSQFDIGNVVASTGLRCKAVYAFSSGNFGLSVNGGSVLGNRSGSIPTGLGYMRLGVTSSGTGQLNGTIRSVQLYNRRIADAYLPALSAL